MDIVLFAMFPVGVAIWGIRLRRKEELEMIETENETEFEKAVQVLVDMDMINPDDPVVLEDPQGNVIPVDFTTPRHRAMGVHPSQR